MTREAKRLVAITLVVVAVTAAAVWWAGQGGFGLRSGGASPTSLPGVPGESTRARNLVESDSLTISAPGAKVTLVEFLDFECEVCAAALPTMKRILADYEGRLTYVVRDFPNHTNSVLAASAAYAANDQGKYWEMFDRLLTAQAIWGERAEPQTEVFLGFAQELGIDMSRFRADLESGRYLDRIQRDYDDALAFGVDGTPEFFINGVLFHGMLPYQEFRRQIDQAIAAAP